MSYRELSFFVDAPTAETLGDALMDLGALSISVTDSQADTPEESPLFGEPGSLPEIEAWDASQVEALFDAELWTRFPQHTEAILAELANLGFVIDSYEEKDVADQDWVQLTQSQFEPIQISSKFWIVPSWHAIPEAALLNEAICLCVDPGLAFGTGSHPTTKLCLQWLESISNEPFFKTASILDYGCGSGILAIASKKLGSAEVLGIDIDPNSIQASRENAQSNHAQASFALPAEMPANQYFDIVVANILANPLKVLAPALCHYLARSGHLCLSGVLARQANDVIEIYKPWLPLHVHAEQDGWVCLTGQKP